MMKTCGTASSFFAHAASTLSTRPSLRVWGECLLLLGVFGLVAVNLGLSTGLFNIALTDAWQPFMVTALVAFIVPAFAEELVFRVLLPVAISHLIPPFGGDVAEGIEGCGGTSRPAPRKFWTSSWNAVAHTIALFLFIVWHPFQVGLGLPLAQALFLDPVFLLLAGLLGLICTISYQRSGSVWPAVFMHWIVVIAWKGATVSA